MTTSTGKRGSALLRIGMAALVAGLLTIPAEAAALVQAQDTVRGQVTDASTGQPVPGVLVQVEGTGVGTLTDANGRYVLMAGGSDRLLFAHIGYRAATVEIGGRSTVDVQLQVSAARLEELVVTGYSTQRRADITGAVSSVNIASADRETSASVLQKLDGQVAGVVVENSGSPGGRSTVRIRGVSSFQNNDPLYIVDGTPVEASYANFLNPHDVESVQVLKDASAASIYGSRANNGVIIIETKKGVIGAPSVAVDAKFGMATPVRGYDDFLIQDPLEYFQVIKLSHDNAGVPVPSSFRNIFGDPNNPRIPQYIWCDGAPPCNSVDESSYSYPNDLIMPASSGTNWWDAVFGTGEVRDVNMRVSGGNAGARYNASFNYFDQVGTAAFNRFQRGTIRLNTEFDQGALTVGENINLSLDEHYGGNPNDALGEGGIIGKNILQQPIVPIYDVAGNYASGKAPGLSNLSNPLKIAENGKDNVNRNMRIFGNAFANLELARNLAVRTNLGFNMGQGSFNGFNPIFPENSEPTFVNSISEWQNTFMSWTWNNTLTYRETFGGAHNANFLVGQEATKNTNRFISGSITNLKTTTLDARYIQDAIGDPATKNVSSIGGESSLLSFFGKADYNFDGKYYLSFTLRRDGSSRLGPDNRWGTFPAFSAGWRLSRESFLEGSSFFTNAMLRFGWGITGNQNIAAGRTVDFFGGHTGETFYDIRGTDRSLAPGFRQTARGNPDLKWEENESMNVGLDLEFFGGSANMELDVYQRSTDGLLFPAPLPATAGLASPPIVNIGEIRNRGVDLALGYNGRIGNELSFTLGVNAATYRNEILRIDGVSDFFFGPVTTRFATQGVVRNEVGHPIGAFYGLIQDGFFQTQAEIDQLNAQAPGGVYQDGAAVGRFKFRDVNGRDPKTGELTGRPDGRVNADDRTVIGSPHPDFTAGLNFGLNWRNWDLGGTVFGTFGNEIFDVQKEFYVFRLFNTNVRKDLLTDSWTPENPDAKYPRLDIDDNFSREISSFYVEDGSYIRMTSLQLGYRFPPGMLRGFDNVRVYVQGENLFTITGYDGLDPSLPAANESRSGMDVRDQARGIDRGIYPSSRTLTVGFNVGF